MFDWWNTLSTAAQIFYCVAIPSTLVLLIQTVLLLIGIGDDGADDLSETGMDSSADVEVDVDGDGVFDADGDPSPHDAAGLEGLRVFTLRGIIAFFVVFGWVGVAMDASDVPLYITLPVAILCGVVTMVLLAFLMRAVMRLRNDGNTDTRKNIGNLADTDGIKPFFAQKVQHSRLRRRRRKIMPPRGSCKRMLPLKGAGNDTPNAMLANENFSRNFTIAVKFLHGHIIFVRRDLENAIRRGINDQLTRLNMFFAKVLNNLCTRVRRIAQSTSARQAFKLRNYLLRKAVGIGRQRLRGINPCNFPMPYRRILTLGRFAHSGIAGTR